MSQPFLFQGTYLLFFLFDFSSTADSKAKYVGKYSQKWLLIFLDA